MPKKTFRHFCIFSGIGTWALASKEVWPDREMVGFCECDPFAQAVLKKHFPDVPIYEDVKSLADTLLRVEQEQSGGGLTQGNSSPEPRDSFGSGTSDRNCYGDTSKGVRELGNRQFYQKFYDLDLLTASPPCQAASTAGKRKGTDDARWLWPATLRIVGSLRPRYFILENVAGLLSLGGGVEFDKVLAELEGQGYEVQPFLIPAAAVGAPHKRDRVWIVGRRIATHATLDDGERNTGELPQQNELQTTERQEERIAELGGSGGEPAADTPNVGHEQPRSPRPRRTRLADRSEWNQDWRTIAERTCREIQVESQFRGMDDGSSDGLHLPVINGKQLTKSRHRQERLKMLGNGIVGWVAVEIMRAIKEADENI